MKLNYCIIICLLGFLSCKNTSNTASEQKQDSPQILPPVSINCVKGHLEKDTIVGNFTGKGIDTLYLESVWDVEFSNDTGKPTYKVRGKVVPEEEGEHINCFWDMASSNPKISTLKVDYNTSPSLVLEGDLDGNGTMEVGILDTWTSSSCRMYKIYTLKNNKWYYLVPPFDTAENLRNSGLELAESSGIKNKIRIRFSDMNVGSCASAPTKDSIIDAQFIPIKELNYRRKQNKKSH